MHKRTLSLTLALALPASLSLAQRPGGPPPGGDQPPGPPPKQQPGNRSGDNDRPRPPLPPPPLLHALDADEDGIISAAEIKDSPNALAKLDKNSDGKLTPNEFLAPRPGGPPPGEDGDRPRTRNTNSDRNRPPDPFPGQKPPRDGDQKPPLPPKDGERPKDGPRDGDRKPKFPPPPLLGALDADHDGVISAAEIADAPNALLTLDKNDDGQIGPRELNPRPPGDRPDGDGPKPPRPPKEDQ